MNSEVVLNYSSSQIDQDKLKTSIKFINIFYPIILSVISTIGNSISIMVFSSQSFKNNGSGFLLKLKALVDTLNVYIGTLRYTYKGLTDTDLKNTSQFWFCFLGNGVYTVDAFSSWLNVFLSLDRVFLVYRPLIYKKLTHRKLFHCQLAIVLIAFSIVSIFNFIAFLNLYHTKFNTSNNTNEIDVTYSIYNSPFSDSIRILIGLIIPFCLMTLCSYVFLKQLIKSKLNVNKYKQNRICIDNSNSRNLGIIKTVLCLDVCFFLFNFPRFLFQFKNDTTDVYILFLQLATILKYFYYSFSFILYIFSNSLYRLRLKRFFVEGLKL